MILLFCPAYGICLLPKCRLLQNNQLASLPSGELELEFCLNRWHGRVWKVKAGPKEIMGGHVRSAADLNIYENFVDFVFVHCGCPKCSMQL